MVEVVALVRETKMFKTKANARLLQKMRALSQRVHAKFTSKWVTQLLNAGIDLRKIMCHSQIGEEEHIWPEQNDRAAMPGILTVVPQIV